MRILVAAIMILGLVLAVIGLVVQRRALAMHGTAEGKGAVSMLHWKPSSQVTRWFSDDHGLDDYFKGQSMVSIGLTLAVAMIAFIMGRGW